MISQDNHHLSHHTTMLNIASIQVDEASYDDEDDEGYDYAELCTLIRRALDEKEDLQWRIGDLLLATKTVYAQQTIGGLAISVGVSPSSLYTWRDMAAFYPMTEGYREDYHAKGLYYSHLRLAMSLGSIEEACAFLDLAALNCWSVSQATLELKRLKGTYVPPMPVFTGVCSFRIECGRVIVSGLEDIVMEAGIEYRVTIKSI